MLARIRHVDVFTYFISVIELVHSRLSTFHHHFWIISHIHALIKKNRVVSLTHTHREGNVYADFLGKLGPHSSDEVQVFYDALDRL